MELFNNLVERAMWGKRAGRKTKRTILVMTSAEWKKTVREMCQELGDQAGLEALKIMARHQRMVTK